MKLSACIVVYKTYEDALNAVRSIEDNTSSDISKTIYIVDNTPAAEDQKKEGFLGGIKKYKDVIYRGEGRNLGFGKGHNYVLPLLTSEYHAIVNPDILLEGDTFSDIIDYMDNNPDIGMVIPDITDEAGVRQAVYRKEVTVTDMFVRMFLKRLFPKKMADHTLQFMDYNQPFQVPFGQGSFLVVRTELFKQLGGFDESFFLYLEDADLCKRVNSVSKLMYFPGAKVVHKWKKESHKNIKLFFVHARSMIQYFNKWGWKWF